MLIYDFQDYVTYIRARQRALPKKGWGFVNRLAEHLRVTQVHVSQVLSRKKDFSLEQAVTTAEFLALNESETEYFLWLVLKSRAGSKGLAKMVDGRIASLKEKSLVLKNTVAGDVAMTNQQLDIFYSDYLYSAIRLFTSLGKGKTIDEISRKFRLTGPRAVTYLDFLTSAGLCEKKGERYCMGKRRTVVGRDSPHLVRHHLNWRLFGLQRASRLKPEEMMMTSSVSLSREDFEHIRQKMAALFHEIAARVRESPAEVMACWNMDWFELDVN